MHQSPALDDKQQSNKMVAHTRGGLRRHVDAVQRYLATHHDSDIARAARRVVRGDVRVVLRSRALRVHWLPVDADVWAETDGIHVWLSSALDDADLYWTLLHEELHGLVWRVGRDGRASQLSEACEHAVMGCLDPRLV